MEDVGLLQIIELFGAADEIACRKATVGKMIEKDIVGHQARHSNDLPARGVHQPGVEFAIVGNARTAELQNIDPAQEGARRAARQHCTLARKQPVPHRMLFGAEPVPVLRDRPVGRSTGRWHIMDMFKHDRRLSASRHCVYLHGHSIQDFPRPIC